MRAERMEKLIRQNLKVIELHLEDESYKHAGHAGNSGGPETHFNLTIVSDDFINQSRVQRQRTVQNWFKEEFANGLHALSMKLLTKDEHQGKS